MASVASQLIEEVTAHAQSDSLEDAREICADGTYFPNNLCTTCCNIKKTLHFALAVYLCVPIMTLTINTEFLPKKLTYSL